MALFGKKDRKTTETTATNEAESAVKVLGSGCAKCNQLEAATKTTLAELGMETAIEHVTDFAEIAKWGVMTTPALVVDGKAVSAGRVLKKEEIVRILTAPRA